MKTVSFYTLGCKLNFSETSAISRNFEEEGFQKIPFEDPADVVVVNTCSVTENADKKCKKIVKDIKKKSPDSFIIIIGCFAQLKPTEISTIPGVNAVLGANEKFKITELLDSFDAKEEVKVFSSDIDVVEDFHTSFSINDRTRTFLKVQDGCDYNCSFCTIPLARGKSRSDTISNIVKTAEKIAATSVKEIVLTGVNIGDFGIIGEDRTATFLDLIQALDEVEGIERIRISSIEPNLLKDDIIEFVSKSKRFVPHFHIPLQSGNDEILKSMRRRYKSNLYQDRVKKIKELMPHCCIGVDVIVGFPGETDQHFKTTMDFLNELDVSYFHVFSYSERDNTLAKELPGKVFLNKKTERSKLLRSLSHKKRHRFYESQINSNHSVLFESKDSDGFMEGFTENYVKVKIPYRKDFKNQLKEVRLTGLRVDGEVEIELLN